MSKGTRPLTDEELKKVRDQFDSWIGSDIDKQDLWMRNKSIFFTALYLGFRVAELRSLKLRDVWQYKRVNDDVYLKKCNTKGKTQGRTGKLNNEAKELILAYIEHYKLQDADPNRFLFVTRTGEEMKNRNIQYIYDKVFDACEMTGKLSTHSTRKTYAKKAYQAVDRNLIDLQQMMGHCNVDSTSKYISFDNEKVNKAWNELSFK